MEENLKQDSKTVRYAKTVLKLVVTLGALYWVSTKVDFSQVKLALLQSNPLFLFIAFIMYAISQVIASSRLLGYFNSIGLALNERYNLKLYLLGLFYNLFLPGGVGGDGYKFYLLRKSHPIPGKKIFSAIFLDRVSGLWALSVFTGALIMMLPQLGIPNWVPVTVVTVETFIYFLIIKKFFNSFTNVFFISHFKAILSWSFQIGSVICLLYALDFQGKFSPYLFSFLLSSLVAIIPLSAGGLGLRELANVYGANYFQLDAHLAVLISLLFYLIALLLALFGAYFVFKPKKLGSPTQGYAQQGGSLAPLSDRPSESSTMASDSDRPGESSTPLSEQNALKE